MTEKEFRSGFIAIIGRPNAGKSTLLNSILGQKVAIVSDKPQTTRNSIRGIYNSPDMQAIFVDTPGIHKPRHKLNERMMKASNVAMTDSDIVLYLVDATADFGGGEEYIIKELSSCKCPVFLIINKIDLLLPEQLLPLIAAYSTRFDFTEIIPVSAFTGENVDRLLRLIEEYLPVGPRFYPEDIISDQPEQLLISELIREQVLHVTRDELPHSVAVTVSAMEERPGDRLYIEANIYVERDSQKGIIIGKQGQMLKNIGSGARREIERILGCPVYLDLHVKAKKDWRNNESLLRSWDPTNE